jgi:hypothetical protein
LSDGIKGKRLFTDGITRPVYAARDGRQYVIDGAAQKVFGLWLVPAPENQDTAPALSDKPDFERVIIWGLADG